MYEPAGLGEQCVDVCRLGTNGGSCSSNYCSSKVYSIFSESGDHEKYAGPSKVDTQKKDPSEAAGTSCYFQCLITFA